MNLILIYDIVHDGTRTKIADLCLDYGLDRIQYSAFEGRLKRTHQEALMKQIGAVLGKKEGKIRLIPICEKDWGKQLTIDTIKN